MIQRMKDENLSLEVISRIVGFDIEKINEIDKNS